MLGEFHCYPIVLVQHSCLCNVAHITVRHNTLQAKERLLDSTFVWTNFRGRFTKSEWDAINDKHDIMFNL